ncbi:MAG TPA: 2-hydroxyacid dehydrogenase [Chloroflexota bacterium]
MRLCVPEATPAEHLAGIPAEVIVERLPSTGPLPDGIANVDFFVPPEDTDRIREAVRQMPSLKVIQVLSAGVDWVLPVIPPGVTLCNGSGIHDTPVSEWVVAAILATCKRFFHYRAIQLQQRWGGPTPNDWYEGGEGPMDDLEGKTVLLLGYGSIGQAVEKRLVPFGVDIVRVARRPRQGVHETKELPTLLSSTDILVVLAPHTVETDGLLDRELLSRLKKGSVVINASRGKLIDPDALMGALAAGQVRAALDVTEPEPLPDGHPLWSAPNVFITPHVAGWSPRQLDRAYAFVRDQIRRYLSGEPLLNLVTDGY